LAVSALPKEERRNREGPQELGVWERSWEEAYQEQDRLWGGGLQAREFRAPKIRAVWERPKKARGNQEKLQEPAAWERSQEGLQ
jgi:hypothetical protein